MEHPAGVYPPVPLTLRAEDEKAVEALADRLVAETLHASENFASQGHVADPSCWKVIKEKNSIVAYLDISNARPLRRDRFWSEDTVVVTASPQNPTLYPTSGRSFEAFQGQGLAALDDDSEEEQSYHHDDFVKLGAKGGFETSVLEKFRPENVPVVFSSGVFPGQVEDMALGFLADTEARTRMRNNTNKEVIVEDTRILAKIHGPTRDDPFRFLGVKWSSHSPSRTVALVVKPRDYLVIESTGIALDSNGQRFCYMLNHSIQMDEVPAFRELGQVRMFFSTCHLMRSCEDGESVQAYSRGFLDIGGSFSVRLGAVQFAEGLVAVPKVLEESYLKKLAWMMRDQLSLSTTSSASDSNSNSNSNSFSSSGSSKFGTDTSNSCSCCQGKLSSRFGGLMEKKAVCNLCRQTVCHKCTVRKLLPLKSSRGRHMKKKDMEFCLNCYLTAKRLPAWHVAVATLSNDSA
ncbi:hypothetical protein PRIC2_004588 [Phytophthora ramorum]